jgi:hypothetical protein
VAVLAVGAQTAGVQLPAICQGLLSFALAAGAVQLQPAGVTALPAGDEECLQRMHRARPAAAQRH